MGFFNFFNRIPSFSGFSFSKPILPFTFAAALPFVAFPVFCNSIFNVAPFGNNSFNGMKYSNSSNQIYNSAPCNYDAGELKNKWKKKKPNLSNTFYNKVIAIAKKIECDPNDLMGVMNSESGLNPAAVNRYSNATGLIQFMPSTAKAYNTSVSALKNMSAEQQLDYVERLLINNKKSARIKGRINAGTLYTLIFLPAFANREVLCRKGSNYYSANRGLDRNHDGQITKNELGTRVKSFCA